MVAVFVPCRILQFLLDILDYLLLYQYYLWYSRLRITARILFYWVIILFSAYVGKGICSDILFREYIYNSLWIDRCQDRALYLLDQYIEIVTVLVQHVIIVIFSVLSTSLVGSLRRACSQAIPMLRSMGVIIIADAYVLSADKPVFPLGIKRFVPRRTGSIWCRRTSRVSRQGYKVLSPSGIQGSFPEERA